MQAAAAVYSMAGALLKPELSGRMQELRAAIQPGSSSSSSLTSTQQHCFQCILRYVGTVLTAATPQPCCVQPGTHRVQLLVQLRVQLSALQLAVVLFQHGMAGAAAPAVAAQDGQAACNRWHDPQQ